VQDGGERRAGIVRQRVPQRERAVCRQLGEQTIRQRPQATFLLFGFGLRLGRGAADRDDGPLDTAVRPVGGGCIAASPVDRLDWRLVLGTDVATLNAQVAIGVDADEHAGASDLCRIVGDGPLVEWFQRGLDLSKPPVDLVREFVRVGVFLLEAVVFGLKAS
jgi:hypothetical protein